MRRTATILLAAALIAGLTACGNDAGEGKPASKPSSASPTLTEKEQYLQAAHEITFNGAPSDIELLVFPELWCHELDSGHSVEWMFDMFGGGGLYPIGEEWGTKKADANELLVAGVKAFCPENLGAVQEELRASGEY